MQSYQRVGGNIARESRRSSADWRDLLLVNAHGAPLKNLANAIHALREAPEWKGVLGFNDFTQMVMLLKRPPWAEPNGFGGERPWTDGDDLKTTEWLQREEIGVRANEAGQAVQAVANENHFHPVRAYLEDLVWDGEPRLDLWLSTHLGVPETAYSQAVGSRWMIAAVARVYKPGCKVDTMLILEGRQGRGKSTALSILAGGWFSDRLSDLGSKDAIQELAGAWIIEMSELSAMRRSEVNAIKAFLSSPIDRFRPAYGRRLEYHPRQCVFAGSVNVAGGYLQDPTGGRRFFPVRCGEIDLAGLRRDRDQLWAEARDAFHRGDPWWLDTPELIDAAAEEQEDRYQGDPWETLIDGFIANKEEITVQSVLEDLLLEKSKWGQAEQKRVAQHLVRRGFERQRGKAVNGFRPWIYRRLSQVAQVSN